MPQTWEVANPSPPHHIDGVCAQSNTLSIPAMSEGKIGFLLHRKMNIQRNTSHSLRLKNCTELAQVFVQLPLRILSDGIIESTAGVLPPITWKSFWTVCSLPIHNLSLKQKGDQKGLKGNLHSTSFPFNSIIRKVWLNPPKSTVLYINQFVYIRPKRGHLTMKTSSLVN